MSTFFLSLYNKIILARPLISLLVVLSLIFFFATQIPKFKLDASAESLVLENDTDLRYYRQISERYGTSDILVLTYSPQKDLFSKNSLATLARLRDDLKQVNGVESVLTILDVPIIYKADLSLTDLTKEDFLKTLSDNEIEPHSVSQEFLINPLYRNRLLSKDLRTTSILITLPQDIKYQNLLKRRYQLREKQYNNELTSAEEIELREVSHEFRQYLTEVTNRQNKLVNNIRSIVDRYRSEAFLHLGGVPMVVADMIDYVGNDIIVFGLSVLLFLILMLTIIFHRPRWVFLTILSCFASVVIMVGYLGLVDWRVTVISSNFISLMLIFTMSLTIHLIVRYQEINQQRPDLSHRELVLESVRLKFIPCLYSTLTTIVAFASLFVSDIRPVIDFGLMMTIGLSVAFVLSFTLFPVSLLMFKKDKLIVRNRKFAPFTVLFARFTEAHGKKIIVFCIFLTVISGLGVSKLKVENRFIDYFRQRTEIYQGMKVIDTELGGTTPLDLIINFEDKQNNSDKNTQEDDFLDDILSGSSDEPWFVSSYRMEQIEKLHDFLEDLPETGEVLSLATIMKIAEHLNGDVSLDNYEIALLNKKIPEDMRHLLITPYVSEDIPQTRVAMRIIESDKNLQRKVLLEKIRRFLVEEMGLGEDQFRFTNMFVLYNNMLQSLFKSQILTIGMVFLGIMLMFIVLFRSFYVALIALVPNLLPAAMVLGTMGLAGIPLDMMTITIAAITIGIAVDDTVHYIHRYKKEFNKDRDYLAAMYRSHASIGRAMYFTSITIIIGFSILVLSNFIPTIYFGLFTCFAMFVALLTALILLPQLLLLLKPFGPEGFEKAK